VKIMARDSKMEIIREGDLDEKLDYVKKKLLKGGIVAFPTETVYGLGAHAFDEKAVKKIFELKNRPPDNPLIVHINNLKMLGDLVEEIPSKAHLLMEKFWPGPLTLIFKRNKKVPAIVSAGLDTIAVRMPSHPIAKKLCDIPIAAPSANKSTRPSPTTPEHVIEDFFKEDIVLIDGGKTEIGLESTVIDVVSGEILRPGKIGIEELKEWLPSVKIPSLSSPPQKKVKSPGMKYRHYSPKVPLILSENLKRDIERHDGKRIGIIANCERVRGGIGKKISTGFVREYSSLEELAANLFQWFRELEKETDVILVEKVEERGIGVAIVNRLKKAASKVSS